MGVTIGAALTTTLIVADRLPLMPVEFTVTVPVPADGPAVNVTVVERPAPGDSVSELGETLHDCTLPATVQEIPSVTVNDVLFVIANDALPDLFTTMVSEAVQGLIEPVVNEQVDSARCAARRDEGNVVDALHGVAMTAATNEAKSDKARRIVSSRGEWFAGLR